jgi:hypothetical protein
MGENMIHKQLFIHGRRIPRELVTLYELGVEPYEIEYLLSLKRREENYQKWKRN